MNNFLLTSPDNNKIPINESAEDDCLRMILIICFNFIMQVDYLIKEDLLRYVKLTMKYLNFVHDPFLSSEIIRVAFLHQKESKPLNFALQNNEGLLDVVLRYMNSFQLIVPHNNTRAFVYNPLAVFNFREPFIKEINPFDALISLILLDFGDIFGGLMNLLNILPNFQLFMRNLILLETNRRIIGNIGELLPRNGPFHAKILKKLVSTSIGCVNVMNEMMSPKYNLLYLLLQSLHFIGDAAPILRMITDLLEEFGFQKALAKVKHFPVLMKVEAKEYQGSLCRYLAKMDRGKIHLGAVQLISFLLASGYHFSPNLFKNFAIPYRKSQEISTLLVFASVITVARKRKRNFLSIDLLRVLRDMLNEDFGVKNINDYGTLGLTLEDMFFQENRFFEFL